MVGIGGRSGDEKGGEWIRGSGVRITQKLRREEV